MVKVLAIEGNRIKLSRKALIKEQKAKLAHSAPAESDATEPGFAESEGVEIEASAAPARPRHEFDDKQPKSNQSTILIEGGDDFEDEEGGEEFDEENEPNFNRVEGAPVPVGQTAGSGRPPAGGPANNNNRRRRRRRPGGGSGGGRGPGGPA